MSLVLAISSSHIAIAIALGVVAGILAGLFVLGLEQHDAQGTSLLAILPTVLVGAWRQHRYGNVRWKASLVLGIAGIGGVVAGGFVAESLSGGVLRRLFAALLVLTAAQLAWKARKH
jgi:uncharacterized membrane protein YfcA